MKRKSIHPLLSVMNHVYLTTRVTGLKRCMYNVCVGFVLNRVEKMKSG